MNQNMNQIIDVLAVYGDYGNVGNGHLIGVFTERNQAEKAAKGRGSLDCGGDGRIEERKAIREVTGEVHLLELNFPIMCNTVVLPDPRHYVCDFCIMVTSVLKPIDFIRAVRRRTGMGLKEAKDVSDKAKTLGRAKIEPFHNNLYSMVSKEEFNEWKQELELNNIATIEAI